MMIYRNLLVVTLTFCLFSFSLDAQIVTLGAGSYRNQIINNPGCGGNTWNEPAQLPLITSNLTGMPIPTNDWWSSLVWPLNTQYSSIMVAHPLAIRAEAAGLQIDAQHTDRINNPTNPAYAFGSDIRVGLVGLNATETRLHDFGDWTVTADWNNGQLQATFGRSYPYIWFKTNGSGTARVNLDGGTSSPPSPVIVSNTNGVALINIDESFYALFGPTGSTWVVTGSGSSTEVTNTLNNGTQQDYFSICLLPSQNQTQAQNDLPFFRNRAYAFVNQTEVDWNYNSTTQLITTDFYSTPTLQESGGGNINQTIMSLLPHQWLNTSDTLTTYTYDTIRGETKVIDGNSFRVTNLFKGITPGLPCVVNSASGYSETDIRTYLQELSTFTPPVQDTYFGGKAIAKLAQAALVAEQIGEPLLIEHHVDQMKAVMEDWLSTDAAEEASVLACGRPRVFHYDSDWGTLIGHPSSFGSDTVLNDHHFHYGYHIMTAAIIAHYDPDWALQSNWGQMVELVISDYAEHTRNDPLFPFLRNFDPYMGHSWASGDGSFADGNNQESSSEAMNAYAAIFLWGELTGNNTLRDLGIYLWTTELTTVANYWFDANDLTFANLGYLEEVVGILWSTKLDYATFFSGESEAILGIQNIPITQAFLYTGQFGNTVVQDAFNRMAAQHGGTANLDLFDDLLWSFLAVENPTQAIALFNAEPTYGPDDGESRAHTYFWLHSLAELGKVDTTITADCPTYSVFDNAGVKTYTAYNSGITSKTVTFSDGTQLLVPPKIHVAGKGDISVQLFRSQNGLTVDAGTDVEYEVVVSHLTGGTITQVEFFLDGGSIGVDTAAPYTATVTSPSFGTKSVWAVATDNLSATEQSKSFRLNVNPGQTPFSGSPITVISPGSTRIQAEDYDQGGQNIAYFDTSAGNSGNNSTYRAVDDVDIENSTDPTNNINIGFMQVGEYLEYTVDVQVGGIYQLDLRIAGFNGNDAVIHMESDGTDVSGPITIPQTGGFQSWQTHTHTTNITLPVGQQILRIEHDQFSDTWNFNWFELTFIAVPVELSIFSLE